MKRPTLYVPRTPPASPANLALFLAQELTTLQAIINGLDTRLKKLEGAS